MLEKESAAVRSKLSGVATGVAALTTADCKNIPTEICLHIFNDFFRMLFFLVTAPQPHVLKMAANDVFCADQFTCRLVVWCRRHGLCGLATGSPYKLVPECLPAPLQCTGLGTQARM
jgi:hypothetical protein